MSSEYCLIMMKNTINLIMNQEILSFVNVVEHYGTWLVSIHLGE